MLEAIIFDMDGVLVDSEKLYRKIFKSVTEELGGVFKDELFRSMMGIPESKGLPVFHKRAGIKAPVHVFIEKFNEMKSKVFQSLELNAGIHQILEFSKNKGYKLAIATSTSRSDTVSRLESLGILGYFDVIVCGDEVENPKPSPDIYLKALRELSTEPSEVVVFEDSKNGILSARNAGVKRIFGILHEWNDEKELLEAGALKVFKLPEDLNNILKELS